MATKVSPVRRSTDAFGRRGVPGEILDLSRWKLTLPTPFGGAKPDEIKQPQLATYFDPHFRADETGGVVFTAPVNGVTTRGSKYARCELREMNADGSKASWHSGVGVHTMTVTGAASRLPVNKAQQIIGQIHDNSRLIFALEIDGGKAIWKTTVGSFNLIDSYSLGASYEYKIMAADGCITVYWGGRLVGKTAHVGGGLYFKAGTYCQANTSTDLPPAVSQNVIRSLVVTH
jgi:hypothetical protein